MGNPNPYDFSTIGKSGTLQGVGNSTIGSSSIPAGASAYNQGVSAAAGIAAWAPVVGPALSAIMTGVGLYMQWRQRKEDIARYEQERSQDIARQDKWMTIQQGFEEKKFAFNKEESRRTWKWNEEGKNYQRSQDFINRLNGLVANDVGLKNNLIAVWGLK